MNGDGRDDWVASVVTETGDGVGVRQLVVLFQNPNGKYVLSGSSRPQKVNPDGTAINEFEVEIANGSFYVLQSNRWRGCGIRDRLQFRQSNQGWQLIGASISDGKVEADDENIVDRDHNLLTGVEVLKVTGRPEVRKKLPRLSLYLRDYPFERQQLFRIHYKGPGPC